MAVWYASLSLEVDACGSIVAERTPLVSRTSIWLISTAHRLVLSRGSGTGGVEAVVQESTAGGRA